jgi:hypothetical protein
MKDLYLVLTWSSLIMKIIATYPTCIACLTMAYSIWPLHMESSLPCRRYAPWNGFSAFGWHE